MRPVAWQLSTAGQKRSIDFAEAPPHKPANPDRPGRSRLSFEINTVPRLWGRVSRAAKGADCKSAGYAFVGSSPTSPTTLILQTKQTWPPSGGLHHVASCCNGFSQAISTGVKHPQKLHATQVQHDKEFSHTVRVYWSSSATGRIFIFFALADFEGKPVGS